MKVLSVRCQYAYLICLGIKDIENRTWKWNYRGPLLIHSSGKPWDDIDLTFFPEKWQKENKACKTNEDLLNLRYMEKLIGFGDKVVKYYGTDDPEKWKEPFFLKSQAIIGKVDLVDIVENSSSEWAGMGTYHWVLENAELFKMPIVHVKGQLRPFEYEYKD